MLLNFLKMKCASIFNPLCMKPFLILFFCISVFCISCENSETKKNNTDNTQKLQAESRSVIKFISPDSETKYRINDKIIISLEQIDNAVKPDSISISYYGKIITIFSNAPYSHEWKTSETSIKTGRQKLIATAFMPDGKKQNCESSFLVLSDKKPDEYTYLLKKKYPHDVVAYTQGLFFDKGYFYEGTGEYGTSSLRKVKIQTGEIIKSVNLASEIFGEGITVYKDKIIQLTWRSNLAFVYDKESFKQIGKFNYSTEGWGITSDGKKLIMSDGSARLYFLDPDTYTQIGTLEVCDYYGQILYLNELEYIKGEIWANVYQEDFIIAIDPENGKVTKKIDLKGILDPKDVKGKIDVLNGIAWNEQNNSIFVTGKWWPFVFEIEVREKVMVLNK